MGAHRKIVSVTRQPLRERTLCSSHPRRTLLWLRSRESGMRNCASPAYSTSISTPLNCRGVDKECVRVSLWVPAHHALNPLIAQRSPAMGVACN